MTTTTTTTDPRNTGYTRQMVPALALMGTACPSCGAVAGAPCIPARFPAPPERIGNGLFWHDESAGAVHHARADVASRSR